MKSKLIQVIDSIELQSSSSERILSKLLEQNQLHNMKQNERSKTGKRTIILLASVLSVVLISGLICIRLGIFSFTKPYEPETNQNGTSEKGEIVHDIEAKIEMTLDEAANEKRLGSLFPREILNGYIPEDNPGLYGADAEVLYAKFANDELGDEMIIEVASEQWFHSHVPDSLLTNTIIYEKTLNGVSSYIYIKSGANIVSYSFTTRDIATISEFCDMVNSADGISDFVIG